MHLTVWLRLDMREELAGLVRCPVVAWAAVLPEVRANYGPRQSLSGAADVQPARFGVVMCQGPRNYWGPAGSGSWRGIGTTRDLTGMSESGRYEPVFNHETMPTVHLDASDQVADLKNGR